MLRAESVNLTSTVSEQGGAVRKNNIEPAKREPPWWILVTVLLVTLALLSIYGFTVGSAIVFVVELMFGVAALSVGALLGFLFGIPRGQTQGGGRDDSSKVNSGDSSNLTRDTQGPGYAPNTNLEQVSDWLTKIIVGVGLVEFDKLHRGFTTAGTVVASSFTPPVPGAEVVSKATMIAFAIMGILASFLWTRVYYGVIQFGADSDIWSLIHGLGADIFVLKKNIGESKEESQKAVSLASYIASGSLAQPRTAAEPETERKIPKELLDIASGEEPEVAEKIAQFQRMPTEWDSDPTDELFLGKPSSSDGRQLVGQVELQLEKGLVLTVRIKATDPVKQPLDGDAIFLLHPTILDPVRHVRCKDNAAEVQFFSAGWFHVAAIVDGGKTVLVLDLKEIPGVPSWFKEN